MKCVMKKGFMFDIESKEPAKEIKYKKVKKGVKERKKKEKVRS